MLEISRRDLMLGAAGGLGMQLSTGAWARVVGKP
jgi:hypothetical protein